MATALDPREPVIVDVVRPGGTVGMANWTQDGFQARLFGMFASYSPVQDNLPRGSDLWGTEELVRERLEGLAASIVVEERSLRWEGESAAAMFDAQVDLAGPQVALRKALPEERWAEVRRNALELSDTRPLASGRRRVRSTFLSRSRSTMSL